MRTALAVLIVVLTLAAISSAALRTTGFREVERPAGDPLHRGHPAHAQGTSSHGLELAVDGAMNPEGIPDERAYAHFLAAMASADSVARNAALVKVGLDGPDRVAFVAGLGSLREELGAVTSMRRTGASAERVLQEQRGAVEGARTRIRQMLSSDGYQRLDAYVRTEVKRGIKIYRAPMMHKPEAAQ